MHSFGSGKRSLWFALPVLCTLILGLFFTVSVAKAQLSGANLSGVVTDESGGPIPGAKISIKNPATGTTRDLETNADGLFVAPNLPPGIYEVTVTAKGFSTVIRKNLTLTVGAEQALNFSMKVGQLTQTVTVSEAPPDVDTTSSTLSATVEEKTVVTLPLNGRDWTQLATLQPGVISVRAQASTSATANRGNRGFGDQLADSGHRPNENTYRVDGININDYSNGSPGSVLGASLGVDAIQEFNVVTTNYTAEYGRTSGAVVNAVTRSGTNEFHGSAYIFDRDKIFDARNFFDPAGSTPPFHRAQFGGSAGGPIIKDNTWIFGDYEGVRQARSLSFSDLIPSAAALAGTICSQPTSGTCATHTITINPSVVPYLGLWPNPANVNSARLGAVKSDGDTVQYFTNGIQALNEDYFTIKADHKFSAADTLSGTYFFDKAPQTTPDSLVNTISEVYTKRQFVGISENHVFSPTMANVARFGFNRVVGLVNSPVSAPNPVAGDTSLGISPGLHPPLIEVGGEITATGGLGNLSYFGHHYNSFQGNDDLIITRGKHAIKVGLAFERMQYDVLSKVRQNGDFRFNPTFFPDGTIQTTALENFLTNVPAQVLTLSPAIRKEVGSRDTLWGGYVQDDWRLRPAFTLNLGLRYEMLTNPTEAHNGFGLLNTFYSQPGQGPCPNTYPNAFVTTNIPGCTVPVHNMFASNPTKHNFEPRVGFSWDPIGDGKMAIRGGFGIFDVLPLPYIYTIGDSLTYPFSLSFSQNNLPPGSFPNVLPFLNTTTPATRWVEPNPKRSYALNWNLNIQRQLTNAVAVQVGYVGSHTVHNAFTTDDSNQVIPTLINGVYYWPLGKNGTVLNTNSSFIRPIFFDDSSHYHGLQSQLLLRNTHGLSGQLAYTYSKCLDQGSGAQLGDPFQNSLTSLQFFNKPGSRNGPCDFDIRQNLSANFLYILPIPKTDSAMKYFTQGWQIGGIVTGSTGVPFSVVTGGDPLGQNSTDQIDYPNKLPGCNPYQPNFKSLSSPVYLNANCFAVAPTTPLGIVMGNAGRNQLIGPGLVDFDFSVIKNTPITKITETANLELRFEFFNIFNHTNFQAPVDNNTLGGGFGLLDSTTTTSRQIQLGAKFTW